MNKFIIVLLIGILIFSCTKSSTTEPDPPPPTDNITVTFPTSGSLLYWDSTYTIQWMKEGNVGNVNVFYRIHDDSLWDVIDTNISGLSCNWTVPLVRTNQGKVKVADSNDSTLFDTNSGYFIIDQQIEYNLVLLICDSFFYMGSDTTETGHMPDESPVHVISLSSFYITSTEIPNIAYKNFCDATGYPYPPDPGFNGMENYFDSFPNYPVVMISWFDAVRYCNWFSQIYGFENQYDTITWECNFSVGYRLPTEAEWEYASRGGLYQNMYSWGNDVPGDNCNWKNDVLYEYTAPTNSFDVNGYGLFNMTGNVWEWTNDYYDPSYYQNSPANDPTGPDSGFYRVIRGGSWFDNEENIRCAKRGPSDPADVFIKVNTLGFRIVRGF